MVNNSFSVKYMSEGKTLVSMIRPGWLRFIFSIKQRNLSSEKGGCLKNHLLQQLAMRNSPTTRNYNDKRNNNDDHDNGPYILSAYMPDIVLKRYCFA